MNFSSQLEESLQEIKDAIEDVKEKGYDPDDYRSPLQMYSYNGPGYTSNIDRSRKDFTNNIPNKVLDEFQNSGNEGLYGYTFLGAVKAWRNERLRGTEKGRETDVHECIHTEWEYETRVLTWWMMQDESKDKKYLLN